MGATLAFAQAPEKRVILLLGPPGAGKTTQAGKLKGVLGIPAVSMSEILRKEGGGKTALNKALKAQIAGGELVTDEAANDLVRKRIARKDAERGFIMDGYPATAKQADYFDTTLEEMGLPKPVVIHLTIPDGVANQRLNERGRADDSPANAERRIAEYRDQAALILPRYSGAVKTIDGTQSEAAVAEAIRKVLGLR
jgi:adenylate kinase